MRGLCATIHPRMGKRCQNDVSGATLVNNNYGVAQIVERIGDRSILAAGNVSSASYVIPSDIAGYSTQSDCSIIAIVEGTSDTTTVNLVELMDNNLGGFAPLAICAGDGSNARWVGRIRLAGANYIFGSAPETAMIAGKSDVVCVVHQRNIGQTLYVNGVKSSAGLAQAGDFDYAPNSATLGRTANRYAGLALFYNRALLDQQVAALSAMFWQGYQP